MSDFESYASTLSPTEGSFRIASDDVLAISWLLDVVLDIPERSPLRDELLAMGIERGSDLLGLEKDDFPRSIPIAHVKRLLKAADWFQQQSDPVPKTWWQLTLDAFSAYVPSFSQPSKPASVVSTNSTHSSATLATVPVPAPVTSSTALATPGASTSYPTLLPGIKRVISDYPKLQKDEQWYFWKRVFKTTAASHSIWHVFDTDVIFVPNPNDLQALHMWDLEQAWCFKVLTHCFVTVKAKAVLRGEFATNNDAQAAYAACVDKYETDLDIINLRTTKENEVKALVLNNNYKKSIELWLEIWCKHIDDFEEYTSDVVSEVNKRAWLTSSVNPHTQMASAVVGFNTLENTLGQKKPFDMFYKHLLGTAKTIDIQDRRIRHHANPHHTPGGGRSRRRGGRGNGDEDRRGGGGRGGGRGGDRGGRGRGRGGGRGNGGNGNWIDPDVWQNMTPEQRRAHIERVRAARNARANQADGGGNQQTTTPAQANQGQAQVQAQVQVHQQAQPAPVPTTQTVQANVTQVQPGSQLRAMLSQNQQRQANTIVINGVTYRANVTRYMARVHNYEDSIGGLGLVDGGCNLCLMGSDSVLIDTVPHTFADFVGINNAQLNHLPIGTCATVIRTRDREIIGIFHRSAYCAGGNTILSNNQMAAFGHEVSEAPIMIGGKQLVKTVEGHVIPLCVRDGLSYMPHLRPPTDDDFLRLESAS